MLFVKDDSTKGKKRFPSLIAKRLTFRVSTRLPLTPRAQSRFGSYLKYFVPTHPCIRQYLTLSTSCPLPLPSCSSLLRFCGCFPHLPQKASSSRPSNCSWESAINASNLRVIAVGQSQKAPLNHTPAGQLPCPVSHVSWQLLRALPVQERYNRSRSVQHFPPSNATAPTVVKHIRLQQVRGLQPHPTSSLLLRSEVTT